MSHYEMCPWAKANARAHTLTHSELAVQCRLAVGSVGPFVWSGRTGWAVWSRWRWRNYTRPPMPPSYRHACGGACRAMRALTHARGMHALGVRLESAFPLLPAAAAVAPGRAKPIRIVRRYCILTRSTRVHTLTESGALVY